MGSEHQTEAERDRKRAARHGPEHGQPQGGAVPMQRAAFQAAQRLQRFPQATQALSPADVLALQRTIGNAAVVRLLRSQPAVPPAQQTPGGPAVQRKTLPQALKADGANVPPIKAAGSPRSVIGADWLQANAYTPVAQLPSKASKMAALTFASAVNAQVGEAVQDRVANEGWTQSPRQMNMDTVATLDPFYFAVTVPFMKDGKEERLSLSFQHAKQFTGYVTEIAETANQAPSVNVTMYDKFANTPLKSTDKFSNVHDTSDQGKVIDLTAGTAEKNLDAYTKIAGEGARWQCVRNHAANLRNDSRFFTRDPADARKAWYVDFVTLWLNWKSVFDKRYNVTDAEVAAALLNSTNWLIRGQAGGALRVWLTHMQQGVDYDLDAGRSYQPAPRQINVGTPSTSTVK